MILNWDEEKQRRMGCQWKSTMRKMGVRVSNENQGIDY